MKYDKDDVRDALDLLQSYFHGGNPVNETERLLDRMKRITMSDEKCGAEEGLMGTGACELPKGHKGRYHRVTKGGKVWAEWSG